MAPRKSVSAAPARRQLSVETLASHSDDMELDDSDLDGDFDPVQAAAELKKVVDGYKKRRFVARKKIEKRYEIRVAEIVKRAEERLAEQEKTLTSNRQQQLARLVAAVEAREATERAIADKVGRFYDGCVNLANMLQNAYTGLAEEARSAAMTDEDDKNRRGRRKEVEL